MRPIALFFVLLLHAAAAKDGLDGANVVRCAAWRCVALSSGSKLTTVQLYLSLCVLQSGVIRHETRVQQRCNGRFGEHDTKSARGHEAGNMLRIRTPSPPAQNTMFPFFMFWCSPMF